MNRSITLFMTLPLLAAASAVSSSARADAGNEAAAEALFAEGKRLVAEGNYAEACPKLAESNRLDRGAGTMLVLANCYEKDRKTATAWVTFKDAATEARALGRKDLLRIAEQHAAELEKKLAWVTIRVEAKADGLTVKRDGTELAQASWGVAIPVDIGAHVIEAHAPGRTPFSRSLEVTSDGTRTDVTVPELAAEPAKSPPPPPATTRAEPVLAGRSASLPEAGNPRRTVGFVVGGIGIASLGVGIVTGLVTLSKANEASGACPSDGGCSSHAAVDASQTGGTFATVSTVTCVAGAAALAAGVLLVLTAPSRRAPSSSAWATVKNGSVVLGGRF